MATVNVASGQPYDITADLSALDRKKQAVAMLAAQMLQKGDMIDTGTFKVADWGSALGKLAAAAGHAFVGGGLGADERAIGQKSAENDTRALMNFGQSMSGTQQPGFGGVPLNGPPEEQQPQTVVPPSKAQQFQGIMDAIASGSGKASALASEKYKKMLDSELTQKDIAEMIGKGHVDPASVNPNNLQGVKLKPNQVVVDKVVNTVDPISGNIANQAAGATFGPMHTENDVPGQTELHTNEFTGKTGGATQPAQSLEKGLDAAKVDVLKDSYKEAVKTTAAIQNVINVKADIKNMSPQSFGPGADQVMFMKQVSKKLFGTDLPDAQAGQTLRGGLGNILIKEARAFAPVTETDLNELKRILGSSLNDKEALDAMMDRLMQSYTKQIDRHNSFVDELEKKTGAGSAGIFRVNINAAEPIPTPGVLGNAPTADYPMNTAEDYFKRNTGAKSAYSR